MVYQALINAIEANNGLVRDCDFRKLTQVERESGVLYTVESPLIRPFDFFKKHEGNLLYIQGGDCYRSIDMVKKDVVFFGIIDKPTGYEEVVGKPAEKFVCPDAGKLLAPIWVFIPSCSE